MEERTIHLKIKIKSLADEAVSIRKEARKVSGMAKWRLNDHRTSVVRVHARHNLLAYGILRGMPYSAMERKCHEAPDFKKVTKIAKNFGGTEEDIGSWMADATDYLKTKNDDTECRIAV